MKKLFVLAAAAAMVLAVSCNEKPEINDNPVVPGHETLAKEASVSIRVASSTGMSTRASGDAEYGTLTENKINTLDVFVFYPADDPSYPKLLDAYAHFTYSATDNSAVDGEVFPEAVLESGTATHNTNTWRTDRVDCTTGKKIIYAVVNMPSDLTANGRKGASATHNDVPSRIQNLDELLSLNFRLDDNVAATTGFQMIGHTTEVELQPGKNTVEIGVDRVVARVRLKEIARNMEAPYNEYSMTIDAVYLSNACTRDVYTLDETLGGTSGSFASAATGYWGKADENGHGAAGTWSNTNDASYYSWYNNTGNVDAQRTGYIPTYEDFVVRGGHWAGDVNSNTGTAFGSTFAEVVLNAGADNEFHATGDDTQHSQYDQWLYHVPTQTNISNGGSLKFYPDGNALVDYQPVNNPGELTFYTMPNPVDRDYEGWVSAMTIDPVVKGKVNSTVAASASAWAVRNTKIVVEATLNGKKCYYTVPLGYIMSQDQFDADGISSTDWNTQYYGTYSDNQDNADEGHDGKFDVAKARIDGGLRNNFSYDIEKLVLTGPGSADPDQSITKANVAFEIVVKPWTVQYVGDASGQIEL